MCKQPKIKPLPEKTYNLKITEAERYKLERLVQKELSTVCFAEFGDSPYKIFIEELLKKIKTL